MGYAERQAQRAPLDVGERMGFSRYLKSGALFHDGAIAIAWRRRKAVDHDFNLSGDPRLKSPPGRLAIPDQIVNNIPHKRPFAGVVSAPTRSHPAEHHAQIVCGHFGDNRSRESNGLRHRGNRLEVSQTPGRVAIAKAPVECLVARGRCEPFA